MYSAFERFKYFTDATSANTIERVVASRTFAVVQTTQGKVHIYCSPLDATTIANTLQLFYTGNGEVFGITDSKETKPGEWAEVPPIPDNDSKITYCTCDTNGTYFIVVCENETAYFRGTNKKGESGEARKNCLFVCVVCVYVHVYVCVAVFICMSVSVCVCCNGWHYCSC